LAIQCEDSEILTVEGLAQNGVLHGSAKGFTKKHGLQCGLFVPQACWVKKLIALLIEKPQTQPKRKIRVGISGNLCVARLQNIVKGRAISAKSYKKRLAA